MRTGSTETRVLAIAGSLRRGSYNRRLLEAALHTSPPTMTIDIYDALGSLPLFNEDLEQEASGLPEQVLRLRDHLAAADGLLIATPEYNQSIPAALKNAIDWMSRESVGEALRGKPVAIIGATAGRWGTRLSQAALRQTLLAADAIVMPAPALFVRDAERMFDADGRLTEEPMRIALGRVTTSFARWIATVGALAAGEDALVAV